MCKSNCNSTPITLAPIVAHLQIQQIQPTVTSLAWWLVKIFTPFLYGYGHSFIFKLPVTCWWVGDGIGWVLKFEMSGLHLWYPHFFQKDISWWKFNPVDVKQNEYWVIKWGLCLKNGSKWTHFAYTTQIDTHARINTGACRSAKTSKLVCYKITIRLQDHT